MSLKLNDILTVIPHTTSSSHLVTAAARNASQHGRPTSRLAARSAVAHINQQLHSAFFKQKPANHSNQINLEIFQTQTAMSRAGSSRPPASRPAAPKPKPTLSFNAGLNRQGVSGSATVRVPIGGGNITGTAGFNKQFGKPVQFNAGVSGSNIAL